ncbi:hypothetical protein HN873_018767, partial [Arachis hypogaea]
QIVLSPKQNCVRTMKYIKDNFMGDIATLHQVISDYTRMRLAVDLVNDKNNSKRDIIEKLAVTDRNKKIQQSIMQT